MHIFIIAEAGVNHNGDAETARRLIDAAAASGADAVKFQTFIPENVISVFAEKAEYQKRSTGADETQLEMIRKLFLPFETFRELAGYAKAKGILFLSTPFDTESLRFLETLGMPVIKIPSGEIVNLPLLLAAARLRKPVLLSTGMSTMEEIRYARDVLLENGAERVSLLHCNTDYPTAYRDANLLAIGALRAAFGGEVGYSDHTFGIEAPIAAAALGAAVIEKHFTLDRAMEGPDHSCSLTPDELKAMVISVRRVEEAMGRPEKKPTQSEMKNAPIARKSLVAARAIRAGEQFCEQNLAVKRPGDGISPVRWFEIIGKTAKRDFVRDEQIEL